MKKYKKILKKKQKCLNCNHLLRRKVNFSYLYQYKDEKKMNIEYKFNCKFCNIIYASFVNYKWVMGKCYYDETFSFGYKEGCILQFYNLNKFKFIQYEEWSKYKPLPLIKINYKQIKPLIKEFVNKEKLKIFL